MNLLGAKQKQTNYAEKFSPTMRIPGSLLFSLRFITSLVL